MRIQGLIFLVPGEFVAGGFSPGINFNGLLSELPDDAFLNRTRLERVEVIGPELGLLLDWSTGSGATFFYKNKREQGSARASPVAAPMPKSVPHWEKRYTA